MHQNPDGDHIRIFRPEEDADDLESLDDLTSASNDPDVPVRPSLDEVFEKLESGQVQPPTLVGFSDLRRDEMQETRQRWPQLPEATRILAVTEVNTLGESRLDLDFGRFLRVALEDDSEIVRQHAISGLGGEEGEDLPERFLQILREDPSDDVRIQAALSLAPFSEGAELGKLADGVGDRIREELYAVLDDPDEPLALRRRALEAVSIFGNDPRLGLEIESMYEDDDTGLRSSAVYAMGRSQDRRWYPIILNEFASDDAEVRYEAARAIGQFGDTSALPHLAVLAKDDDDEVRLAAIAAIGEIGGQPARRLLQKLADDTSRDVEIDALDDALQEASIFEVDPDSDVDPDDDW